MKVNTRVGQRRTTPRVLSDLHDSVDHIHIALRTVVVQDGFRLARVVVHGRQLVLRRQHKYTTFPAESNKVEGENTEREYNITRRAVRHWAVACPVCCRPSGDISSFGTSCRLARIVPTTDSLSSGSSSTSGTDVWYLLEQSKNSHFYLLFCKIVMHYINLPTVGIYVIYN